MAQSGFHIRRPKPELLRRWFSGPPGWTLAVCEFDFRVGGGYRYVWQGQGMEMGMGGVFVIGSEVRA
jgi:uncharacterized protein YndB with AHSA1/START domain